MMKKDFLLEIFKGAYMQRWNDLLRPLPLYEIDKQGHKLMIAYFIGKFEQKINWIKLIEGAVFEYLQRLYTTDLNPIVFRQIKKDKKKYAQLNKKMIQHYESILKGIGGNNKFFSRFKKYFEYSKETIEKKILRAAHLYSSKWEFDIISKLNNPRYTFEIKNYFENELEKNYDLEGLRNIILYKKMRRFIFLCGELRYQIRWSNQHRIPKTSVLGHSLMVAILSYIFSLYLFENENLISKKRIYNNFFTGLFHDLPEVLTRDIISPIKNSVAGLDSLIKEYEIKQMNEKIYILLPDFMKEDFKMFTEYEFKNIVHKKSKVYFDLTINQINKKYNKDKFNVRDGYLVRAADELSAFLEANEALKNGCNNNVFENSVKDIKDKYISRNIGSLKLKEIYTQF